MILILSIIDIYLAFTVFALYLELRLKIHRKEVEELLYATELHDESVWDDTDA